MNATATSCCGDERDLHTTACRALHGKWVIRRDGFCDDPARPYTIWRHDRLTWMFYAWDTFATRDDAQTKVDQLIEKYKHVPREPK